MVIERLTRDQAVARTVESVGLDPESLDCSSPEVLAALIRRAASFTCPTTGIRLLREVIEPLAGLVTSDVREPVRAMIDALVGIGDLVETRAIDESVAGSGRLLYLGPPAFVSRASGSFVLLGIRPEGASLVGDDLSDRLEYESHVRRITFQDSEDAVEDLKGHGLHELASDQWLAHPHIRDPEDVISEYAARLSVAGPAGDLGDVEVLDPQRPVSFYAGRWRPIDRRDEGRFVGRRRQAFGSNLWCYFDVRGGDVAAVIDLPVGENSYPGCDEAWWLQAAIDATLGQPQRIRVERTTLSYTLLSAFSPLPSWIQRRLDIVGIPVTRQRGALLSYRVDAEEVQEELEFMSRAMWLEAFEKGNG